MICIFSIQEGSQLPGAITGWIIATDADDARRQLDASGHGDLAGIMYRMHPDDPKPGNYLLRDGVVMLVT